LPTNVKIALNPTTFRYTLRPKQNTCMKPTSANHRAPKPAKPEIVHTDDAIVLVNKPAGVWPREGIFDVPGVFDMFEGEPGDLHQIYPLEMEVSGLALYARSEAIAEKLVSAFDNGEARVYYHCIVGISMFTEEGVLQSKIDDRAVRDSGLFGICDYDAHQTDWKKLDGFVGFALLECSPQQRTPLQVRKHLGDNQMHLAVDPLTGGGRELLLSSFKKGYRKSKRRPERPLIQRPSLNLQRVTFPHPESGDIVNAEAEPPKDFRATLNQLDRYARAH